MGVWDWPITPRMSDEEFDKLNHACVKCPTCGREWYKHTPHLWFTGMLDKCPTCKVQVETDLVYRYGMK